MNRLRSFVWRAKLLLIRGIWGHLSVVSVLIRLFLRMVSVVSNPNKFRELISSLRVEDKLLGRFTVKILLAVPIRAV